MGRLKPYNAVGKFKFWCNKVLPTVYDNSLSYYEVLTKLAKYLNDLIENMDTMEDNIDELDGEIGDMDALRAQVNEIAFRTDVLNMDGKVQEDGTYLLTGIASDVDTEEPSYSVGWDKVSDIAKELVKYSSDEIVVGTWINGKTVYQKTIRLGSLPTEVESSLPHSISSMLQCIDIKGYAVVGSYYHPIAQIGPIYVDTTNIHFAPLQSINDSYVTIQYTKTTD